MRIHSCHREGLGWPELVGNELAAAPEFGHRWSRCYGAREGELVGVLACCGAAEHGSMLGYETQGVWLRRRHRRRIRALGRGG